MIGSIPTTYHVKHLEVHQHLEVQYYQPTNCRALFTHTHYKKEGY